MITCLDDKRKKKLIPRKHPTVIFSLLPVFPEGSHIISGILENLHIREKSIDFFSFEMLNRFLNKTSLDVLKNSCGCESVSLIARRTFTLIAVA